MGIAKDHQEKKQQAYEQRQQSDKASKSEAITDTEENKQSLDRYKAQPVEDYKPLFKKLHAQNPIERRY